MSYNRVLLHSLLLTVLGCGVAALPGFAGPPAPKGFPTVQVTGAGDTLDGDVSSLTTLMATPGTDGVISLREAIAAANNTPGVDGITFAAVTTITVTSELPEINDTAGGMVIDGGGLVTLVNGSGGSTIDGLRITTSGNIISGLTIQGFGAGIRITGSSAVDNLVKGCTLGSGSPGGGAGTANGNGIVIDNSASVNEIGGSAAGDGNVISGNTQNGVYITGGATSNVLVNNFVGTSSDGSSAVPNGGDGILIDNAHQNEVADTIFGTSNIISGNTGSGIRITNSSTDNLVGYNTIGLSLDQTSALPNLAGVRIDGLASANVIGSNQFQGGNIIAGNTTDGVQIIGASGNTIQNNFIGTDRSLETGMGNGGAGILVNGSAENNILGTPFGYGNTLYGNSTNGIRLDGALVQFNPIRENNFNENGGTNILLLNGAQGGILPPSVDPILPNAPVSGSAAPNSTVELFVDDEFEGIYFYTRVTSDGKGFFTTGFPLQMSTRQTLLATVTDPDQNTSAFSTPVTIPATFMGDPGQLVSFFIGYDANGDDLLDANEYDAATGRGLQDFNAVDTNSDGFVSPFELLDASAAEAGFVSLAVNTVSDTLDAVQPVTVAGLLTDPGPDGKTSLREALLASQTSDNLKIEFTVSGNILPASGLPPLSGSFSRVVVRGGGNIVLDGTNLSNGESGLSVQDSFNLIEGLRIVNFPGAGINMTGSNAVLNYVIACDVGTDGAVAQGNGTAGIKIDNGSSSNVIGGGLSSLKNVISGNPVGIWVDGPNSGNTFVYGNYIGVDETGMSAIPNTLNGIQLSNGSSFNYIAGLLGAGFPNIISGNGNGSGDGGVSISGTGQFNLLGGNYIGLNAAGEPVLGNNPHGVRLSGGASGCIIGFYNDSMGELFYPDVKLSRALQDSGEKGVPISADSFGPNIIAGNTGDGVQIDGAMTAQNSLFGNSIYSNGGDAIVLLNGANDGIAAPVITGATQTSVSGTGIAGTALELFGDDEDEARVFLGLADVDPFGNWTFQPGKGDSSFSNFTAANTTIDLNTSRLSNAFPANGASEGEGEGEGECTDPTDSDGDGLSDCDEMALGTNPDSPDTDGDGMTDGFEVQFFLNALSNLDALLDSDGDGLSNLEEFLGETDPNDANDPGTTLFVDSETGVDMVGNGGLGAPFRTINFAMNVAANAAGTVKRVILLANTAFNEDVILAAGVVLSGPSDGSSVLAGSIRGADGATVQDLSVMPVDGGETLCDMDSSRMILRRVRFVGSATNRAATGVLAQGSSAATGVIDGCDFIDLAVGVDITGGVPTIRKSIFVDPGTAGIYVRGTANITGDSGLSTSQNAASGFNTFTFDPAGANPVANPTAVINDTGVALRMENNDWGTDDDAEVEALIAGPADFSPKLAKGSAILASTVLCTLFDNGDQKRLTAASVTLMGSGFGPVTDNDAGVYVFPAVIQGAYSVLCETNGYVDAAVNTSVGAGEIKTVNIPMGTTAGGEGEGEGEGGKPTGVPAICGPGGFDSSLHWGDMALVLALTAVLLAAGRRKSARL